MGTWSSQLARDILKLPEKMNEFVMRNIGPASSLQWRTMVRPQSLFLLSIRSKLMLTFCYSIKASEIMNVNEDP